MKRLYWKSLDELENAKLLRAGVEPSPAFLEKLHREFPAGAELLTAPVSRRHFLTLMGSSMALAGLSGCANKLPPEEIVPYVRMPEYRVPTESLAFATAHVMQGLAVGLVAQSITGRPIKIDGNPDHPMSLGATRAFDQAALLGLYDPERAQEVLHLKKKSSWAEFEEFLNQRRTTWSKKSPRSLCILTGAQSSPTLRWQFQALREKFPSAEFFEYEALHEDNQKVATAACFGQAFQPHFHFDRARVVVAIESDFLNQGAASLNYARSFSEARREKLVNSRLRLYSAEVTPSLTGAMADERLAVNPEVLAGLIVGLAREAGVGVTAEILAAHGVHETSSPEIVTFIKKVSADAQKNRGQSVLVFGSQLSPFLQGLCLAINNEWRAFGLTLTLTPRADGDVLALKSLAALTAKMERGEVSDLLIFDVNAVYAAPASVNFCGALKKVENVIYHGRETNETADQAHWHLPASHFLESWGDALAVDGTATIIQPLISPLYETKSDLEIIAMILQLKQSAHAQVQSYWQSHRPKRSEPKDESHSFQHLWHESLRTGLIEGSAFKNSNVRFSAQFLTRLNAEVSSIQQPVESDARPFFLVFKPDPTIHDGSFASNPWLQELPKPITKLVWDNAALISKTSAQSLDVANGDVVEISTSFRREGSITADLLKLNAPIWIQPGQPDGVITLHLGYGRQKSGSIASDLGFNAYKIWNADTQVQRAAVLKTHSKFELVTTQSHHSMEGRDLIREVTVEESLELSKPAREKAKNESEKEPESLYSEHPKGRNYAVSPTYAWGMSIDLDSCIGCSSCVISCQAENNIPVVGKAEVARGREMHWLRIDRYFEGPIDQSGSNIRAIFQPVLCMHCEKAPCEVVCPAGATTTSSEGINEMVYNRCVGTRYCSNNCPYKVRRFNFFEYNKDPQEITKLSKNPNVSVRSRGVMEKCTFCIQRINATRIKAEAENRSIRNDELKTACQVACPTQAIVFGNQNDPTSEVSRLKRKTAAYKLLDELGTRPRVTYLPKVINKKISEFNP